MSEEEFALPNDVTGLATLRTTLTHKGLLALNVGIVDANFHGKISTALINFSTEGRTIYKGEKFFRIIFFEHNSIPDQYKNKDSALPRPEIYQRALSQFPKNFLNIPELNEDYYGRQFGKMLKCWIKQHYLIVVVVTVIIGLNLYSLMDDAIKLLKWWNSSS